MSTINVTKRDGSLEPWDIQKIKKSIEWSAEGVDGVDPLELERSIHMVVRDGIKTTDIINELIGSALSMISLEEPNWSLVAGRLATMDLNKTVRHNVANFKERNVNRKFGYSDFSKFLAWAEENGVYKNISSKFSQEEIALIDQMVRPETDLSFHYCTTSSMQKSYLQRKIGKIVELPQEMYMGIAMTLAPHVSVNAREKMETVKSFYNDMRDMLLSPATPVVHNMRTPNGSGMSCAVASWADNLNNIDQTIAEIKAESSKGTGWGLYAGKIRSKGSSVQGHPNVAGGSIPFIVQLNYAIVSVDQLGARDSNIAVYQDVWHADIIDFLELKLENKDVHQSAQDIFLGVCVNDEFMRRRDAKEMWTLIDPHEAKEILGKDLCDFFGDEWTEKYKQLEACDLVTHHEINAMDLWKKILSTIGETGDPYIFSRDRVNAANNNPNYPIYCSNLCSEICSPFVEGGNPIVVLSEDGNTSHTSVPLGYTTTCNLVSINLGRLNINNDREIERVSRNAIRLVDAVITENSVVSLSAKRFNRDFRSAGVGYIGYAHMLAKNGLRYGSKEALEFTDKLLRKISYYVIDESMRLAANFGAYPKFPESNFAKGMFFGVKYENLAEELGEEFVGLADNVMSIGVRNGYMFAIAPNTSTSGLVNETPSIYPVTDKMILKDGYSGTYYVPMPELDTLNMWYKPVHAVSYTEYFDTIAIFQKRVDQSISCQTYFDPNTMNAFDLHKAYVYALTETRAKTIYYVRQKPVSCVGCAN